MVVRMRHTRGHSANRRSHHALSQGALAACPKCGEMTQRHRACPNCGTYREKTVIDVVAKIAKKEAKRKQKSEAGPKT